MYIAQRSKAHFLHVLTTKLVKKLIEKEFDNDKMFCTNLIRFATYKILAYDNIRRDTFFMTVLMS